MQTLLAPGDGSEQQDLPVELEQTWAACGERGASQGPALGQRNARRPREPCASLSRAVCPERWSPALRSELALRVGPVKAEAAAAPLRRVRGEREPG